jgi:phospholipase/carboxylesterase
MLKFLAVLLIAFSGLAQARMAPDTDFTIHTDLPLSYVAQVSPEAKDRPLVIFLHGYGSNEMDLYGMKDLLPADYNYLSVRAPLSMKEGRYLWFTQKPQTADYDGMTGDLKNSGEVLRQFIEQAAKKYQTPPTKVFLVGFSQGAMMSYEIGLRHPELVGGFAALSGKVLPVLRSELKADPAQHPLAVFIGHGKADNRVPFSGGSDAETYLQTLNIKPEFHGYAGVGHTISEAEIGDLKAWLERVAR